MRTMQRSNTGKILHTARPVATCRPMHLTMHVRDDVPGLRRPAVLALFRELLRGARARGIRTVMFAVLRDHIHWVIVASSATALANGTRYVFGQLGARLNALFGRVGKVFTERYWSSCCDVVRHAFQVFGYVLKNAREAGHAVPAHGFDRYTAVDDEVLAADPFLRSVVGLSPDARRELLLRMARGRVPFVPLCERMQPRLL